MPDNYLIALFVILSFGLIAGYFVARRAAKQEPIYSGTPAMFFNYLASSAMISILPGVLLNVFIFRNEFLFTVSVAFSSVLLTIVWSMLFAVFENAPRKTALAKKSQADKGWTEEDARKSGL